MNYLILAAGFALLGVAHAGHEFPFYPSFYSQEITVEALDARSAAQRLAKGTLHAYAGEAARVRPIAYADRLVGSQSSLQCFCRRAPATNSSSATLRLSSANRIRRILPSPARRASVIASFGYVRFLSCCSVLMSGKLNDYNPTPVRAIVYLP